MPVIDNREVTNAEMASIVITPNKVKKDLTDDGKGVITEVVEYYSTMVIRYSLQDSNGHLEYKNVTHTSPYTSEPLDDTGIFAFAGGGRPSVKEDKMVLSDVDIDKVLISKE